MAMKVDHVQETIRYTFFDSQLLCIALKAAHRSDEDERSQYRPVFSIEWDPSIMVVFVGVAFSLYDACSVLGD
jgi:hypothetical protein